MRSGKRPGDRHSGFHYIASGAAFIRAAKGGHARSEVAVNDDKSTKVVGVEDTDTVPADAPSFAQASGDSTLRLKTRIEEEAGLACLVCVKGPELARRYMLVKGETILGRSADADIRIHAAGVSRHHAKIVRVGDEFILNDQGSTNGTIVNGRYDDWRRLHHGDRLQFGDMVFRFLRATNIDAAYYDEMYRLTTTDDATGSFNRRYFFQTMEREIARSVRHGRKLSLMLIDVDRFEAVREAHGRIAGDAVLLQLAARIAGIVRAEDVFARIGGGEFCLLFVESDDKGSRAAADRILQTVRGQTFSHDEEEGICLTVSIGLADFAELQAVSDDDAPEEVVERFMELAEKRLEEAISAGGDRVLSEVSV